MANFGSYDRARTGNEKFWFLFLNGGEIMWGKTKFLGLSLLLALCFSLLSATGSCSEKATAEQDTLIISRQDWETLKRNNAEQKRALEESQRELSEVKKAQAESEKALIEAQSLLETSQMTSDEMTKLCATLLNELNLSRAENAKLTQELKDAKAESMTASDAIAKANQYLADMREEILANEAAWRKREAQLERQRVLWQVLFALAVGGGIALAT